MNLDELNKVAQAMVAPGKGILAADESSGTIKSASTRSALESTEDSRRDYREMLFRSDRSDVEAHLRRHPLRRDHLAEGQGRHAAGRAHQEGRARSPASRSMKAPSRCRIARARSSPIGLDKPRRPAARILRAGRTVREVARRDRHRPGHPDATPASVPTRTRSRATPRCARRRRSCRSSSRKC